ncbi:MAG TPA: hypothetical protein VNO70_11190, partial [Blastocatellia bacterium]|nr:hypothetical protein [Blastocatellia bacterium]
SLLITTAIVTVVWLAVTYLTKPVDEETLVDFYCRTRPGRAGWGPIARLAPEVRPTEGGGVRLIQWALGCAFIYFSLFGVGSLVFGQYLRGILLWVLALACGYGIFMGLARKSDDELWQKESAVVSATRATE